MTRKLTYKEIAREAGVSVMSVSNALRRPGEVRKETLGKVHRAIEALGGELPGPRRPTDRPVAAHRPFHRLRLITCGLPQGVREAPVYNRLIQSMIGESGRLNFDLSLTNLSEPNEVPLARLQEGVDVLLLMGKNWDKLQDLEGVDGRPAITLTRARLRIPTDHVGYSEDSVGRIVADHLSRRNVRHAAYVGEGTSIRGEPFRHAFLSGGGACRCTVHGSPHIYRILGNAQSNDREEIERILEGLLEDPPEAIFCHSDQLAASLRKAILLKAPERLAKIHWVGCNNDPPWRSMLGPEAFTIELGMKKIGQLAVERAVEIARNPGGMQQRLVVEPFLVPCS